MAACVASSGLRARTYSKQAPKLPKTEKPGKWMPERPKPDPAWRDEQPAPGISAELLKQTIDRVSNGGWTGTPQEYINCINAYEQAVADGAYGWTVELPDFSPQLMHETACLLRMSPDLKSQRLSRLLWSSAAHQGHQAALLTLVRDLIFTGRYNKKANYSKIERIFKSMVTTGLNSNALTLEGEHLFFQKKYPAALRHLEKALKQNKSFEWKLNCQFCLARTYRELGRTDDAEEMFHKLHEQGMPEAGLELGYMLHASDPDRAHELLFEAACRGRPEVFSHLSEIALDRSSKAEDAQSREEQRKWAMEWSRLADKRMEF
ncbi:hypothetical protein HJFPF1_02927 [Paramyrothecium foliicola]|nr:hypothetical protein HJFPF1_02927 [Paramyrothecium foliicola]